jgi:hypothetical protein
MLRGYASRIVKLIINKLVLPHESVGFILYYSALGVVLFFTFSDIGLQAYPRLKKCSRCHH